MDHPASEPADSFRENSRDEALSARLESFDSYWQAPADIEKGYASFYQYYKSNYLPHMPADASVRILVVSCGPGYLVNTLRQNGYMNVLGIDSDPEKIAHATARNLPCETQRAFEFVGQNVDAFDVIIPEQELNHLTIDEQIEFLKLCYRSLRSGGLIFAYGLNGANPLVGSENLAHNIDHFNTFTEYSIAQVLQLAGLKRVHALPLKIYVFWKNPLNYVGLVVTGSLELLFRIIYKMYGKNVKILSKKVAAIGYK